MEAISWNGEFSNFGSKRIAPTNAEFKEHFEKLGASKERPTEDKCVSSDVYIPVLDDDITPEGVQYCVNPLDKTKAAGADGIQPGILGLRPAKWILHLAALFNMALGATYPAVWQIAKMFTSCKGSERR